MRKALTILLLGTMVGAAAPALAQDASAQDLGERLRARIAEKNARYHEREERREERAERRQERREERAERREERREDRWERRDDRRDDRRDRWDDRRDRWDDRWDRRWRDHWDDRRGYAYRDYGGWNRQWTPYGFGYHDDFTRSWVLRHFADRNGNGRISEREWRRGQAAFYRFADRNYDGYITRFEYDWAIRALRSGYAYRW